MYDTDQNKWIDMLPGSAEEQYLIDHGLTKETMKRFMLGTDGRYLIIPYNEDNTYYGQFAIDGSTLKQIYLEGVKLPLFNPSALYKSDICYVVQSPICAMSIEQCGQPAVAISGAAGIHRLLDQLQSKPANTTLILCLDNNPAGINAALAIKEYLTAAGYKSLDALQVLLGAGEPGNPGCYLNANEVMLADQEELKHRLQEIADACRQLVIDADAREIADRAIKAGPESVDHFLDIIQTERYKPIPTGIRDIDAAIGGGLIRQQLVLLGAAPGAGKTALAQWIFEEMAKAGSADILYINLEMSREQMLARSIARVAKQSGLKIKTTDILQGYKWTSEQRATVISAANLYKNTIAPHISYNPDGISADLDTIAAGMENEAVRAEKSGKTAPICVIDYLQIVKGGPREDAVETIKRAVTVFKSYAVRHKSIVFVIMATNRDSNRTGDVTMESGRDTSALEYSADLQLGLAFTRCLDRPGYDKVDKVENLKPEEKQLKTLKITKGRFGGEGVYVDLRFDGETMTFTQIAKDQTTTTKRRK